MKKIIKIIFLSIIFIFIIEHICYSAQIFNFQRNSIYVAKVIKIVDGDTIVIKPIDNNNIDYEIEKIRLIGIDTPETVHPRKPVEFYGPEASNFTKNILSNNNIVYIEIENNIHDLYGRLLAYIWLNLPNDKNENYIINNMLNAMLIKDGYAAVLTIRPNVKYKELFYKLQQNAVNNKIGLWQLQ